MDKERRLHFVQRKRKKHMSRAGWVKTRAAAVSVRDCGRTNEFAIQKVQYRERKMGDINRKRQAAPERKEGGAGPENYNVEGIREPEGKKKQE